MTSPTKPRGLAHFLPSRHALIVAGLVGAVAGVAHAAAALTGSGTLKAAAWVFTVVPVYHLGFGVVHQIATMVDGSIDAAITARRTDDGALPRQADPDEAELRG